MSLRMFMSTPKSCRAAATAAKLAAWLILTEVYFELSSSRTLLFLWVPPACTQPWLPDVDAPAALASVKIF